MNYQQFFEEAQGEKIVLRNKRCENILNNGADYFVPEALIGTVMEGYSHTIDKAFEDYYRINDGFMPDQYENFWDFWRE